MQTIRLELLPADKTAPVLDLGCGQGRHAALLCLAGFRNIVGVDIQPRELDEARARVHEVKASAPERATAKVEFQTADGTALPFADASFQTIVCSEMLEHVPHYYRLLDEAARVLQPGGCLAVSVPRLWPETLCWWLARDYPHQPGGHIRIFRAHELRADIEARGFTFARKHWAHGLHSPWWWLQCAIGLRRAKTHWAVRLYHRLLAWEMFHPSWFTKSINAILDPLMGKSTVLYFYKQDAA